MFGFRDKDKEQLEENMDEIKQLINQGKPAEEDDSEQEEFEQLEQELNKTEEAVENPAQQEQSFEQEFGQDSVKETQETGSEREKFDEPVEQAPARQKPTNQIEKEEKDPQRTENLSRQQEDRSSGQRAGPEPGQKRTEGLKQKTETLENRESRLNEQIPEPPKSREIDVPEIDAGPLFIRRKKFERAQELIHEMRYMSQEIEQVMNRLETGIKEDHETERKAKEILHTLDQDREDVKKIISPENRSE